MSAIKLGKREIKRDGRPFTIAEAGINHNGQLDKALAMVELAKRTGVDAIKFQTFKADEFVSSPEQLYTYRSQGRQVTESMLAMFRRYELSRADWFAIKEKCDKEGITFLSTPQNPSDLELLLEIGVPAVKVGSDDFVNLPLLEQYARAKLPLILSCGMADLAEVHQALATVGALDGYPVVLLLCTSEYPTPAKDVNLRKLQTLAAAFPQVVLGFSDHTRGPLASSLAVAMGAVVFEKHFTLSHDLPGPDHWFSEDPDGLKAWATAIREAHTMLGSAVVRPTAWEKANKKEFQRVIVAGRSITCGEILGWDNLAMRRLAGGNGLPPGLAHLLIGKPAGRDYAQGEPIGL